MRYRVLLADYVGYESTAEIPYMLARAGAHVDIYCPDRSWLAENGYWKVRHAADTTSPSAYVRQLTSLASGYDRVILCDDTAIRIVNDLIGEDEALALKLLPISKLRNRAMLGSKAGLALLCAKHGIPTPVSAIYGVSSKVMPVFPLLAKEDRSEAGAGVHFCANEEQLAACLAALSTESKKDLVLQEYITGDNIAVEAVYGKGVLLAYVVSRVISAYPNEFGTSFERMYGEPHGIGRLLVRIGEAFGADGFSNMTFMRDRVSGAYLLIEMDMRPQAWFRVAKVAGVDFSLAVRRLLSGAPGEVLAPPSCARPFVLRHFSRDVMRSIKERDFSNLLKWMCNQGRRWRAVPLYDLRLMRSLGRRGLRFFLKHS